MQTIIISKTNPINKRKLLRRSGPKQLCLGTQVTETPQGGADSILPLSMEKVACFGPRRAPEDMVVMHQTCTTVTRQNQSVPAGLAINDLAAAVTEHGSFSKGRKCCKDTQRTMQSGESQQARRKITPATGQLKECVHIYVQHS